MATKASREVSTGRIKRTCRSCRRVARASLIPVRYLLRTWPNRVALQHLRLTFSLPSLLLSSSDYTLPHPAVCRPLMLRKAVRSISCPCGGRRCSPWSRSCVCKVETVTAPCDKEAEIRLSATVKQGALLPLTYQHLVLPLETFMGVLPKGYDPSTDMMTSSLRVEIAGAMNAQCESFSLCLSCSAG